MTSSLIRLLFCIALFLNSCQTSPSLSTGATLGTGMASWYGKKFHGRQTANGERYDMYDMTAAHKTLPFGTWVRVKSMTTGKSVDVRINDRGPFIKGRIIDLSFEAAKEIGLVQKGVDRVKVYRLRSPASQ